jgi:hypothetical protein
MPNKELSNIDVALFALLQLGGFEKRVHTEEIAYKAFQLDPARFSWRLREYRDKGFPDKEPVRIALMDAAKPKNGQLVDGRSGVETSGKDADGWILTPAGAKWIREREQVIRRMLRHEHSKLPPMETSRFIKQIKRQPLYAKFKETGDLRQESQFAFTDMLNLSPDASRDIIAKKFLRLRSIAELASDSEVRDFLEACARTFSALFPATGAKNQEVRL